MPNEFIASLKRHQDAFGLSLSDESLEKLDKYYRIVLESNPKLHLVGQCSDEEFATRHILESIYLLTLTGKTRTFADVGTGAGLPGIPCLLASEGLRGYLIESKQRKGQYLAETVPRLGLESRCEVINRQFAEIKKPNAGVVVCRAIDRFVDKIPKLVEWSGRSTLALFAGHAVKAELESLGLAYSEFLIPLSERRFIFLVEPPAGRRRKT